MKDPDVLSRRPLQTAVGVSHGPEILLVPFVSDPRIAERANDVAGAIGRTVVADEKLEVPIALGEDGLESRAHVGGSVVDGHTDADPRASRPAARHTMSAKVVSVRRK